MNPWYLDPTLYVAFWRILRAWYLRRWMQKSLPKPLTEPHPCAGCQA
ncbi:MAG TPA: hypothetical protein VE175_08875 [Woeseiaceae bacterium]|nr:hypothetical protein [Woeseiaceae bacterium]